MAVERGDENEVLYLLNNWADVNIKNLEGVGPLHIAVAKGHHHLIGPLINHGGFIELIGQDGYRPIHMITFSPKKSECLEQLIAHNVNINGKDRHGNTLLQSMIKWRYKDVQFLKKLIECGSNPNCTDSSWNNCLHSLAVRCQIMENADIQAVSDMLLAKIIDVDAKNRCGDTALFRACQYNNSLFAKILLQNGADMLSTCKEGLTPFDEALRQDNQEILEEMMRSVVERERSGEAMDSLVMRRIESNAELEKLYVAISKVMDWL
ncbi:ankyrin repeat, PH and SEC7 domain containing protein secG-like [Coccinella septempunctata]|uniref:ankyrin repeat, PH and SEC7 domain containing protein secG-like n=1 Tax=Coccinella septempunctata TaxID=41139 RepID=UPI001D07ED10|nr:ankyrin repeat, PH and SEC7 domain containing protein secG-like [Coccinella septempunctata]